MQVIGDDYDDVKHPNLPFQALEIAIDIAKKRRRYLKENPDKVVIDLADTKGKLAEAAAARKKSKKAEAAAARKKEKMAQAADAGKEGKMAEAADAGKEEKKVCMFVFVMSMYFTSVFFNTIVVCN